MSGKGALDPHGAQGGAMGKLGGLALWDGITDCPDAGRPGLGACLEVVQWHWRIQFFCRELSFFKFHIMGYFEALVGCIPELVSLGTRFITNQDHSFTLWL